MKVVRENSLQGMARSQTKATDQFTGMPRSIRTRLLNPRKKSSGQLKASVEATEVAVERECAVSADGKNALGPWLGPFMPAGVGAPEEPTSPTMFVHYKGRVFSDLEGGAVHTAEEAVLEEAAPSHGAALVASALPRQRKDHTKELALMGSKGAEKRSFPAMQGSPRVTRRRTRNLNQPRSGF